jgi:Ser/Thr protein kinase RdoA (MazF antagonist)
LQEGGFAVSRRRGIREEAAGFPAVGARTFYEVREMAVHTVFERADLEKMLSGYSLGRLIDYAPIQSGAVQTNYRLTMSGGETVLRYYENRTAEAVLFEKELIGYLHSRRFPCAGICENDRAELKTYRGKPYVLFEFKDGEHVENPGRKQRENLIRLIAQLNGLTQGLHLPGEERRFNYTAPSCIRLAEKIGRQIGTRNAREKQAWMLGQLKRLRLPDTLETGICHCDFHYTNLLYQGDEIAALLDFDDANYTYLLLDLISAIDFFTPGFDHETWRSFPPGAGLLNFRRARECFAAYSECRAIGGEDRRHVFDLLKLSILIDCLWYFERGDCPDFFERRKVEAVDGMGRERFTRALFG